MRFILGLVKKPFIFFKNLSLKKKIFVILAIIVCVIFISTTLSGGKENGYVTEPVKRATISQSVSETGNVDTGAAINVKSPSTGIVEEIYVTNGQAVTTGEILFKVKSSATEQEKSAALASYMTAKSSLDGAKANEYALRSAMYDAWDTYYNLSTGDAYENADGSPKAEQRTLPEFQTAQHDWLAAEAQLKNQQNVASQAQAQTNSTWLTYQATQNAEVKANSDGVIANLGISQGNDVAVDDSALTIVTEGAVSYVLIQISEIDISKIASGQKAKVEVDAISDKIFDGVVERVDSIGTNTQGVITYDVFIRLNKVDDKLRSGMTANVDIATETIENTLSVPNSAIKPYQGGRAVQVLENGKPKYIPIKIGVRGDTRTQILNGLTENQQIIVGAKNELIQRESGLGF